MLVKSLETCIVKIVKVDNV